MLLSNFGHAGALWFAGAVHNRLAPYHGRCFGGYAPHLDRLLCATTVFHRRADAWQRQVGQYSVGQCVGEN